MAIIATGFQNTKLYLKFASFAELTTMAKSNNIVHLYFRKEDQDGKSLLKINPIHLTGIEIVVPNNGEPQTEEFEVPSDYEVDFPKQGYALCTPIEFNLYWSGVI
jgi:hypothetical protein